MRKILRTVVAAATAAAALSAFPVQAKQATQDWLWLSAHEASCTWTITVTWSGFNKAKTLEVFVTEGYAGTPVAPTQYAVNDYKGGVATVTVTLAPSATATLFYPWAHLLDAHGVPIPASLDFSGQTLSYCTAP
jgi:hypothetical protein